MKFTGNITDLSADKTAFWRKLICSSSNNLKIKFYFEKQQKKNTLKVSVWDI